jgi:Effector-associated domain 1/Effector-associated domain 7
MQLTGPQHQELRDALISAYPSRPSLEQMVRFKLNENLNTITGDGSLAEIIFNLINWAEAQGRLEELVTKAHAANSGNPQLRAFVDRMQPFAATPSEPLATPLPLPDPVAIREALIQHFSLDELRLLTQEVGVDYDNLPGETKMRKALELVLYFERRGGVGTLVAAVRRVRSNVI